MNRKPIWIVFLFAALLLTTSGPAAAQAKKAPADKATAKTDQIDLNSATKDQLMTLTGIGDALSQKIIAGRPYRAKNELVRKKIIPQSTYDRISAQIVAKQSGAAKKDTAPKKAP